MLNKKTIYTIIVIILLTMGSYILFPSTSNNSNETSISINNICNLENTSLEQCDNKIVTMTESDTSKYDEISSMQYEALTNIPGYYESFFTSEYGYFRLVSKKSELNCDKTVTVTGLLSLGESPCTANTPQTKDCSHLPRIIVEKFECNYPQNF